MKGLLKEIMANSFPNLERQLAIQVHEANRSPPKLQSKTIFSKKKYIMKLFKVKDERTLKATRENIFLLEKGPNLKAIRIFLNRDLADQEIMG